MTLWPGAMHTGWSRCPVQVEFPVCSSPGRGCGSGGYKAAGEARRGRALDLRPSGHHARGPECGVRGGPAPALRASPQDPAAAAGLGLPPSQVLPAAGRPREGGGRLCAGTGLRTDAALTLSERRFPVKTGGLEIFESDEDSPKVFSSVGTPRRLQCSSHQTQGSPARALEPRPGGQDGNCGCFSTWELARFLSTGAAAPFRTDKREQEGSCFTNKIHFPELLPDLLLRRSGNCRRIRTGSAPSPPKPDCSSGPEGRSLRVPCSHEGASRTKHSCGYPTRAECPQWTVQ